MEHTNYEDDSLVFVSVCYTVVPNVSNYHSTNQWRQRHWRFGGPMASAESEPITGVQGQSPWSEGEAPWSWKLTTF